MDLNFIMELCNIYLCVTVRFICVRILCKFLITAKSRLNRFMAVAILFNTLAKITAKH